MTNKNFFEKGTELQYKDEEGSIGRRAVKGGVWTVALKAVQRALGFVRIIILARLLSPNDFGLMGVALLAINVLETFSQTGFDAALVQKKENIKDYLDTAWTVQLARSAALFSVLYFGAPLVAHFFNSPRALGIIRVLAFYELLIGANNIGIVYFQKELRFDKRFIFRASGFAANMAVSVTLAFLLKNVWALVYGSLAAAFVLLVMSYILHPYRPRLKFDFDKTKELLRYGKWLFGSSILVFLITQGDDAIVGKIIGITALGFYQMAYNLSNAPTTEMTHVIEQVTFPVYSKIQDNLERLRKAYLEVVQLTVFISMPLVALIFVLAHDFTRLFLGQKWLPIVPAMRVLCIAGLMWGLTSTTRALFRGTGRPKLETFIEVIRLVVMFGLIIPLAVNKGIVGVAAAVLCGNLAAAIGYVYSAKRAIMLRMDEFFKIIAIPAINSFAVFAVVTLLKTGPLTFISFFSFLIAGLAAYVALTAVFCRFFGYQIWEIIKGKMGYLREA